MENLLLTCIRLVVPLSIFRWPLFGVLAALYIDLSDWHWYHFQNLEAYQTYQLWDKALDTYYLGIAWFTSIFLKDKKARMIAAILFFGRVIGVVFFTLFSNSIFLVLFPNIFEVFFLFYLVFVRVAKTDYLFLPHKPAFAFLILLALPKLIQEYFMHWAKRTPSELLQIPPLPGIPQLHPPYIDIGFWILLFLALSYYALLLKASIKRE